MVAELQRSAKEFTLNGSQIDHNEINHNRQCKVRSAKRSCLKNCIVSNWDNKAAKNQTENTQKEIEFKDDTQQILKQTYGND